MFFSLRLIAVSICVHNNRATASRRLAAVSYFSKGSKGHQPSFQLRVWNHRKEKIGTFTCILETEIICESPHVYFIVFQSPVSSRHSHTMCECIMKGLLLFLLMDSLSVMELGPPEGLLSTKAESAAGFSQLCNG